MGKTFGVVALQKLSLLCVKIPGTPKMAVLVLVPQTGKEKGTGPQLESLTSQPISELWLPSSEDHLRTTLGLFGQSRSRKSIFGQSTRGKCFEKKNLLGQSTSGSEIGISGFWEDERNGLARVALGRAPASKCEFSGTMSQIGSSGSAKRGRLSGFRIPPEK